MKVAFIPVRGGSKSIPLKNIKPILGKPLIYWVVKAASESSEIDEVVVASDSQKINRTVESFNLPKVKIYSRKTENAQDHSSTESVMLEYIAAEALDPRDVFILIQCTSPFTRASDLDAAISKFRDESADSLLSVVENKRFYWDYQGQPINYDHRQRPRRQDFQGNLLENGAFYISKVSAIKKNKNRLNGKIAYYIMPEYTGFEIDEPHDWIIVEALLKKQLDDMAQESRQEIKLFATDVDGVLTDAGMYYTEKGDELKKFNTRDGMGFEILRNAGIKTAIITSENTQLVKRRAEKLKVDYLFQGIKNKLECATELCSELGFSLSEMAYIGDDINDKKLLQKAGYTACPNDAATEIKSIPNLRVLSRKGGFGVFREFVELYLN